RRRHTRSYGDWSSDMCSSDLMSPPVEEVGITERDVARTRLDELRGVVEHDIEWNLARASVVDDGHRTMPAPVRAAARRFDVAGRDRKSVGEGKSGGRGGAGQR